MVRNNKVYACIGSSSHSPRERERNDLYITDPSAVELLEKHNLLDNNIYWETACGTGSLSEELKRLGYTVVSSDLFDYGYGDVGVDFFKYNKVFDGNTLTNPPYNRINDWIKHSLEITKNKVYLFCRIQTIETVKRYHIFKENPPIFICPFVRRINCYRMNDDNPSNSAVCYAWFIWDNMVDNTETKIKWLI